MDEFELIRGYFKSRFAGLAEAAKGISFGIGDDCAVFTPSARETVVSTDTLIAGRHFPDDCCGSVVASRSLGAAASDLAAAGAEPLGYTLALSLPNYDEDWLGAFSDTLLACSAKWQLPLVGGDTVCGPLAVTITVFGRTDEGQALFRKGAHAGDHIWVSGCLGDAAGGLQVVLRELKLDEADPSQKYLMRRYEEPEPRLKLGQKLCGLATAVIDISDGLLADLGHIMQDSSVGAQVDGDQVPVSPELNKVLGKDNALIAALTGGDDYELCFTVPSGSCRQLENFAADTSVGCMLTRIGTITADPGLEITHREGEMYIPHHGYNHFPG